MAGVGHGEARREYELGRKLSVLRRRSPSRHIPNGDADGTFFEQREVRNRRLPHRTVATRQRTPPQPLQKEEQAGAAVPRTRQYSTRAQPPQALITAVTIAAIAPTIAIQSFAFVVSLHRGFRVDAGAGAGEAGGRPLATAACRATRNAPVTFSISSFAKTSVMNRNRPLSSRSSAYQEEQRRRAVAERFVADVGAPAARRHADHPRRLHGRRPFRASSAPHAPGGTIR